MILIKILLVLVPCSLAHDDHVVPPDPPCNCLTEYRPVCGVHNSTHINRCIADCLGDRVNCEGECPCKTCTDDTGEYPHGEEWECPDGCNTCFCMNGVIGSTLMACLPLTCTDDTGEHQHEESWECPDGCNTCFCVNGVIISTEMACHLLPCTDDTGEHQHGELWKCPDGCNTCSCTDGMIGSTKMECPPIKKACTDGTGEHQHEESWTCPDGCNTCSCTDGKIRSTKKACPVPTLPSCVCTREFDPVCGEDGMDYSNKCMAECEGVVVECEGRCPCPKPDVLPGIPKRKGCSCPDKAPVCGEDGRTYPSRCQAQCEEVEIACEGECICIKNP